VFCTFSEEAEVEVVGEEEAKEEETTKNMLLLDLKIAIRPSCYYFTD
jgi:hypothetical protein